MRSLDEVSKAACSLPIDYREEGLSPMQVVANSEYGSHQGSITIQAIYDHLQRQPELLGEWIMYSENKRTSSGWYIDSDSFRVGYQERGFTQQQETFGDRFEACAHYIRHELDSIIS